MTRAGSGQVAQEGAVVAPFLATSDIADVETLRELAQHLTPRQALAVRACMVRVLAQVRAGADTAARTQFDGSRLTYADGWHAASVLVALTIAQELRAQDLAGRE